jgi:site-specific recombinase XerD
MTTTAIPTLSPQEVLPHWLEELQANDRASGTIRRYKSAVEGFFAWYSHEEQPPLTFSMLTPIALVGYRNYVQRTHHRATSTVNGQISALKARVVPLNASARQSLAEYVVPRLNYDPTGKAMARSWPRRSSNGPLIPFWQSQKKGILTTSTMRQMIERLVRDTAARGFVPIQTSAHTLRHTFACHYLSRTSWRYCGAGQPVGTYLPQYHEDL